MIRWLYNNIPYFRRQILLIKFENQSKPNKFESLTECFIDSNGMRYYKYMNDYDMPIVRFNKLSLLLMELTNCFTGEELDLFLDAIDELFIEAFEKEGKSKINVLSKIGYYIKEAKNRKKILLREDILFGMISCLYIREDQDATKWDEEIENQKIEQFKKDSSTGLYDFFYNAGLTRYIPYLKDMKYGLEKYLQEVRLKIESLNNLIISGRKSFLNKENILN